MQILTIKLKDFRLKKLQESQKQSRPFRDADDCNTEHDKLEYPRRASEKRSDRNKLLIEISHTCSK